VSGQGRDPLFVLIHSPLVGPTTCAPTARELKRRGRGAVIPSLLGVADAPIPQWRTVPETVRAATEGTTEPIVLVGHSGAGLLLPTIAGALTAEVAGLIFVDSFLPAASGVQPLASAEFIDELRALAANDLLPPWSTWFGEAMMSELIPDKRLRAAVEEEMPRAPLSYFEASVPLPEGWGSRPCAYLLLAGDPYRTSAAEARARGWPVSEIQGQHLAMASEPVAVAEALLDLERALAV
jgi:hypothetical protein